MMSELPDNAPTPRLCHIVKWPDFDGYGFNLHADKNRPGQYIGKVDSDSPAETAGLKEYDRIVEVNGVNISNENHKQVVQRIKSIENETRLLVVDKEADQWYKDHNIVISSSLTNVLKGTSIRNAKDEEEEENHEAPQETPTTNGRLTPPPSSEGEDRGSLASAESSQESEASTQPQPIIKIDNVDESEKAAEDCKPSECKSSDSDNDAKGDPNVEAELQMPDEPPVATPEVNEGESVVEANTEVATEQNPSQVEQTVAHVSEENAPEFSEPEATALNGNDQDSSVEEDRPIVDAPTPPCSLSEGTDGAPSAEEALAPKDPDDTQPVYDNYRFDKAEDTDKPEAPPNPSNEDGDDRAQLEETAAIENDSEARKSSRTPSTNSVEESPAASTSSPTDSLPVEDCIHPSDATPLEVDCNEVPPAGEPSEDLNHESPMSVTPTTTPTPPPTEPSPPPPSQTPPKTPPVTQTKLDKSSGGLNLNMTAAEMRAQLASKKKFDPRKDNIDLKKKYQIIQNL